MHQIGMNQKYVPVTKMKNLSEIWRAVPGMPYRAEVMLFIRESSTGIVLMDHCNQSWAFRVDGALPFSSSH